MPFGQKLIMMKVPVWIFTLALCLNFNSHNVKVTEGAVASKLFMSSS